MDVLPPELACSNCGRTLDATDKFCRECGLPTVRRAQQYRALPTEPPDTNELQRAMDVVADPRPFQRPGITAPTGVTHEETTNSAVRLTNPTFATRLAGSTALMLGIMAVLVVVGLVMLVLALRP